MKEERKLKYQTGLRWRVGADPGNDLPDCPLNTALTRAAGVRATTEKQQCAPPFGVRVGGIDRGVASAAGTTVGEPKVAGGEAQQQLEMDSVSPTGSPCRRAPLVGVSAEIEDGRGAVPIAIPSSDSWEEW
ncbi:hypothetical protein BDN70DRAFT_938969 [Pholiota conissans]|uniref:Uncharacterized protein n=1 Tax=Pholiota conissans TaxID=109636 RepID=A0A9P5YPP2_9AGAR|nr:hypothetical protein BDN70DRAFT_938969 [Pholiota conissans]